MFVHGIQIVSELFVKELLLVGEGNVSQMSRKRKAEMVQMGNGEGQETDSKGHWKINPSFDNNTF